MTSRRATFYFDFISPYAFLGWRRLHDIFGPHDVEVRLQPVLFAGMLNHYGQLGPAEVEPKRRFVFRQVFRRAHRLGIALRPPPGHPFNPLLALRVTSIDDDPQQQRRAIDALFEATWVTGNGVHTRESVVAALDKAGLDGAQLAAQASTPTIKSRLRAATDAAIADGVFGVPTVVIDGELFWGDDSMREDLPDFLRGCDPLDQSLLQQWSTTAPAAVRPGSKR